MRIKMMLIAYLVSVSFPTLADSPFLEEMARAQRNVSLALIANMCGYRSDRWLNLFQTAFQMAGTNAINRWHPSQDELAALNPQADRIFQAAREEATCSRLRTNGMLDHLDSIERELTGNYH